MLFLFYLLLFLVLIYKIPFFKTSGINYYWLAALFVLKIIAGIAYAVFYSQPQYIATADTWRFYNESLQETNLLKNNPLKFITDLFTYGYQEPGNVFKGENSYWNDLKSNLIIKLLAICNIVTGKSYYTNIIIFNFLFLFGLVGLAKTSVTVLKLQMWKAIIAFFLIPGTLFWCSGIHKDGLILSATGLIIYWFYNWVINKVRFAEVIAIACSLVLIFVLRNFVALALIIALFSWWLSLKSKKAFLIFFGIYSAGAFMFFFLPFIIPSLDFPQFLATKQHEFLGLQGGSGINVTRLQGNLTSYLNYLPTAIDMAFFRPHLTEAKNPAALLALFELWGLALLLILTITFKNNLPGQKNIQNYIVFLLFFAVSVLLIAGFTVTFTGALVRYRSFALPFIVLPLLASINFSKIWSKS